MRIVLVSEKTDYRVFSAITFLEQIINETKENIEIYHSYLERSDYEPEDITISTLASLGVTKTKKEASPLTKSDFKSSVIIAIDHNTRNLIQKEFQTLVPLYNEVSHNQSECVEEISQNKQHIISTIHYFQETAKNIIKNHNKFL